MYYIGIDIGSTAAKIAVLDEKDNIKYSAVYPTGWSSIETAEKIRKELYEKGYDVKNYPIVATGYGRISVPYADKTITEISCHALGSCLLFGLSDFTLIDIGGQDTKAILIKDGAVCDFVMNDKCAAGTGRFLEVMANNLAVDSKTLCAMAEKGKTLSISSMCTVFAESEVISLIGRGEKREDIAYAILQSICQKVCSQVARLGDANCYRLTGGLCSHPYILKVLSERLKSEVKSSDMGRYAGAIGAALYAKKVKKK